MTDTVAPLTAPPRQGPQDNARLASGARSDGWTLAMVTKTDIARPRAQEIVARVAEMRSRLHEHQAISEQERRFPRASSVSTQPVSSASALQSSMEGQIAQQDL